MTLALEEPQLGLGTSPKSVPGQNQRERGHMARLLGLRSLNLSGPQPPYGAQDGPGTGSAWVGGGHSQQGPLKAKRQADSEKCGGDLAVGCPCWGARPLFCSRPPSVGGSMVDV